MSSRSRGAQATAAEPSELTMDGASSESIQDLLGEITEDMQQLEKDEEAMEVDPDDPDQLTATLHKHLQIQKKSSRLGKRVGDVGTPAEILHNDRLTCRVDVRTMRPISYIRPTPSLWNAKTFSRKLREALWLRTRDPDEEDEKQTDDDKLRLDPKRMRIFVDHFASQVAPGLAPNLMVVYGAHSTAPPKPKPGKSQVTQKDKDATAVEPKDLAQVVKKLKNTEINASVDPTIERVDGLFHKIQETYAVASKELNVMSLLVDRHSFQKTVERFFCFSFLLKDNRIRMFLDKHNSPVCTPAGKDEDDKGMEPVPDPTANQPNAEDKFQIIMMNLTESSWRKLISSLELDAGE